MSWGERWHFTSGSIDWEALEQAVQTLAERAGMAARIDDVTPTTRRFVLSFLVDDAPDVWFALLEAAPEAEDDLEPPWDGVEYQTFVAARVTGDDAVLEWSSEEGDNQKCVGIVGAFTARVAMALGAVSEDEIEEEPITLTSWNPKPPRDLN